MPHFISHVVDDTESIFPYPDLLETEYLKKYKNAFYKMRDCGYQLGARNYLSLLNFLTEIHEYNERHANGFAKTIRSGSKDWNNCEATFSEIIVYRYYIRLVHEQLIKSIERNNDECDLIIGRNDGSRFYLEVFCVMPNLKKPSEPGEIIVSDIKSNTQQEMASIRQKLLRKIEKQKQFTKSRENYAVIELNDTNIAGDFTILSSLSSGYKITIDTETLKKTAEGYDWKDSVFEDESTRFLKGIIYFNLGSYESRKFILNPFFKNNRDTEQLDRD